MDWSYGLLSAQERVLFRRLSVFSGGFTLEAAEVVCTGAESPKQDEVLDLLSHLVDKSLVMVREWGEEARYELLETVRQYGLEKLEESGEAEAVFWAHANLFLALAEEAKPRIKPKVSTADRRPWLERLEAEHDNLRAALRWAVETNEAEMALRLAGDLFWFWHMRGYLSEGRRWFERGLAEVRRPTAARAEALYYWGYLAWIQGDLLEAAARVEESVAIWRKLEGRRSSLAHALWLLGLVVLARGEPSVARSLAEESVRIFRTVRVDEFGLSMSLAILGIIVANQEEHTLASDLLGESVAVARKVGDEWFLSLPLRYLGAAAFRRGDYDCAAALIKESLVSLQGSGEAWYIGRSVECLTTVVSMQDDHDRAARLFGAGEALRESIGASVPPFYLVDHDRGVNAARAALGEEAFAASWAQGTEMSPERAIEYGLSADEPAPPTTLCEQTQEEAGSVSQDILTTREWEVASLVARGLTNRQIAEDLSISAHTAENHVRKILKKLGLRSRAQVAAWVAQQWPPS